MSLGIAKKIVPVTIAAGASLSSAAGIGNFSLVAIEMPAAWDAAAITMAVSWDGLTYRNVYDALGNEYSLAVAASRYVLVKPDEGQSFPHFIKLRSGTAASAVNQTAEATINLILRPVL